VTWPLTLTSGHTAKAQDMLRQTLEIFQRIGQLRPLEFPPNFSGLTTPGRPRTDHDARGRPPAGYGRPSPEFT